MGAELDIYTLYLLQGKQTHCQHALLLRVKRPGYSNAVQPEEDWANDVARSKQNRLLDFYTNRLLSEECPHEHDLHLEGEFQYFPPGDDLYSQHGMRFLDIWLAPTRFGSPWIVLGTAESATAFWQEIMQDSDLAYLQVQQPVTRRHVFFLTENDG